MRPTSTFLVFVFLITSVYVSNIDASTPEPFGFAEHFTNLDGIEVLDDGTFLVSDFKGNAIWLISVDRQSVRRLIELDSPADIGLD